MLKFIIILIGTAIAHFLGLGIGWLFIKKYRENLKAIIFVETLLILFISIILIKEGMSITSLAILSAFVGLLLLFIVSKTIRHKRLTRIERISYLIFIAMCFHEFPEGIAFSSSYLIDVNLGLITAIIIAIHNIPEGLIVSLPYLSKKKNFAAFRAVLITQILYLAGALLSYYIFRGVSEKSQGIMMAFAAGAMVYIIIEQLSLIRKKKTWWMIE